MMAAAAGCDAAAAADTRLPIERYPRGHAAPFGILLQRSDLRLGERLPCSRLVRECIGLRRHCGCHARKVEVVRLLEVVSLK